MKTEEEVIEMLTTLQPLFRCEGRYVKFRGDESWYWRLHGNLEMLGWIIGLPSIIEIETLLANKEKEGKK